MGWNNITNIKASSIDNTNNDTINDIIGNKNDTECCNSLIGLLKHTLDHLCFDDRIMRVYPSLTEPITLTSGSTSWEFGNLTTIIPANTITQPFRIKQINIGDVNKKSTYEIFIYQGDNTLIGHGRTRKDSSIAEVKWINIDSFEIPANTEILGKVACLDGNGSLVVSLTYKQKSD
jgi:hypothetical protein